MTHNWLTQHLSSWPSGLWFLLGATTAIGSVWNPHSPTIWGHMRTIHTSPSFANQLKLAYVFQPFHIHCFHMRAFPYFFPVASTKIIAKFQIHPNPTSFFWLVVSTIWKKMTSSNGMMKFPINMESQSTFHGSSHQPGWFFPSSKSTYPSFRRAAPGWWPTASFFPSQGSIAGSPVQRSRSGSWCDRHPAGMMNL